MTGDVAGDATADTTEDQSTPAMPSAAPAPIENSQSIPPREDGSLGIGSLKGDFANE
jgi:hypothetical protein